MHNTYPRTVRVFRMNRGMQIFLEIALAVSSALFVSYVILHLPF